MLPQSWPFINVIWQPLWNLHILLTFDELILTGIAQGPRLLNLKFGAQ